MRRITWRSARCVPKVETLILENGVLTAHRGARTYRLSLREYPQVVPYVESIRATLAGDRAALERFFTPQFSGTLERLGSTLVPSDATVARTRQGSPHRRRARCHPHRPDHAD